MKRKFSPKKENTLPGTEIKAITPDTDITDLPYQGVKTFNDFYSTLCNQCFAFDLISEAIVSRKFTGAAVASMSPDLAINVFNALEKAKISRTKVFLELMSKVANDAYWNRQLELQRELFTQQTDNDKSNKIETDNLLLAETERKKILRLLQQSIQEDVIEAEVE